MNMMKKLSIIPLSILLLMISACGDKVNNDNNSGASESYVQSNGNWKAKANELSSKNKIDIKSDLELLNGVVDSLNSKSIELRDEVVKFSKDKEKMKEVLVKSQEIQQKGLHSLMDLNFKSSEVQSLRTKMIENLMLTQQMYEFSNQPNFDVTKPSDDLKQLLLRSNALQKNISEELNQLNSDVH